MLAGFASLMAEKNNKMLHKNQYLLLPHVPSSRNDTSFNINNSNYFNTKNNNETSDNVNEDLSLHHTLNNNNFLMENSEHNNVAVISENEERYFEIFKTPLRFGTNNNTEITAQIGSTAHLPCIIHNLGEGVVSKEKEHFFFGQ